MVSPRIIPILCISAFLFPAAEPVGASPDKPFEEAPTFQPQDDSGKSSHKRRRRRKRLKRRSSDYQVTEVSNGGTIEGIIRYKGKVPPPRKIQVVKDHETCDLRDKLVPRIKINDQQQVAEAVVFLGDIRAGKAIEPPATKPAIDQRACTFSPHVQVIIKDQPLEITNSDPLAHSAHITQHRQTIYNRMQPQQGMSFELTVGDVGLATLRCDVHDWMRAYLYVLWHPYYTVTQADGAFRFSDVPAGEYELVVWQETLGEQTRTVKVEPGKVTTVDFELTRD